jgi:DNA-directed RNA polymerase omega subunit
MPKCEDAAGSKYDLVLIAACRAREIAKENSLKFVKEADPIVYGPIVSALLDIQNGAIDCAEYLSSLRERNQKVIMSYSGYNNRSVRPTRGTQYKK